MHIIFHHLFVRRKLAFISQSLCQFAALQNLFNFYFCSARAGKENNPHPVRYEILFVSPQSEKLFQLYISSSKHRLAPKAFCENWQGMNAVEQRLTDTLLQIQYASNIPNCNQLFPARSQSQMVYRAYKTFQHIVYCLQPHRSFAVSCNRFM